MHQALLSQVETQIGDIARFVGELQMTRVQEPEPALDVVEVGGIVQAVAVPGGGPGEDLLGPDRTVPELDRLLVGPVVIYQALQLRQRTEVR